MRTDVLATLVILALVAPAIAASDAMTATQRAKARAFDATGEVGCAQEVGQSLGTCRAAVARADGSAAVVVTFANGFSRTLIFSDRAFLRGNATMSGVGTDTEWHLSDGIYHVRVDDQRFELSEALVFGK
ncbi:hypothetical protein [Thetidibacter halocola]|uniref:Uncharacterized protein n=1 Tax=Thetidibacter halocola TaxID=2827239 RepID=A0A8J7WCQ3_9RHOB|nr:hypothetical protein [Thetidibacter halocola]MBS0122963.1 hypothetical protein [Thetidibacter halocola]